MDRIIIHEVDNTSNVESLASYDVAYVPGFSNGPEGGNGPLGEYYRTPTLVTDKYDFMNRFGKDAPQFTSQQPYPADFPDVAVKWSDNEGAYISIQTNNFNTIADIVDSEYYTQLTEQISGMDSQLQYYSCVLEDATEESKARYVLTRIDSTTENVLTIINSAIGHFVATPDNDEGGMPKAGKTYYLWDSTSNRYVEWAPDWPENTVHYTFDQGSGVYTQVNKEVIIKPAMGVVYHTLNAVEFEGGDIPEGGIYTYDSENYTYTPSGSAESGITYWVLTEAPWQVTFVLPEEKDDFYEVSESDLTAIFTSNINPAEAGWFELSGEGVYDVTEDTYIDGGSSYYTHSEGIPAMFEQGDSDPGWRYAYALLSLGMPVYFEQMNSTEEDINVKNMYQGLNARFTGSGESILSPDYSFDNMGDYSVKFITSGGYPTFEYGDTEETNTHPLATAMIDLAKIRKDAIALIDHTDNPTRPLSPYEENSVIAKVRQWALTDEDDGQSTHGAMFTPWYECSNPGVVYTVVEGTKIPNTTMPGSLAYLTALATQVQAYNPWLAVSGVTRGKVPYCGKLHTNRVLTNNIADTYQVLPDDINEGSGFGVSINPITYIRNYGYCIWGNRTLRNNSNGTKAASFLNIRSAVSDIKKRIYEASQQLLFEQNTDVLWLNFKSLVTPLLERMKTDYILNDYALNRLAIDPQTGREVPAYKVLAVIRIQPINSVEVFDLTVFLENVEGETVITTSEE